MLLGQTLDGMRVWDVRRAIQAIRSIDGAKNSILSLIAEREMAGVALYAALFEPQIDTIALTSLSTSHRNGPDFINVLKYLDVPQTVAMVAEKTHVGIFQRPDENDHAWANPLAIAKSLGWNNKIAVLPAESDSPTPASSR